MTSERYPMCKDQPAQIDCRREDCKYHQDGACVNVSPAITIKGTAEARCWSFTERLPELKPCPFCGDDAYMSEDVKYHGFCVECSHCVSKTGNHTSKEYAIDAWNKRTP